MALDAVSQQHHQQQQQQQYQQQHHNHNHNQQHPPDFGRSKRRHARKTSANHQTISSIIASLDSTNNAPYTYAAAEDENALTPPRLKHSQSFGMDYGAYRPPAEEQGYDSEGADFPVIRTARRPSGKSSHTAPPSPTLNGLKDILRATSKTSLLLNSQERLSRSNSRLSAESWVKSPPSSSKLSLESTADKSSRKLSFRQTSRDTLRSQRDHQHSADQALLGSSQPPDSKDPPRSARSSKSRLYLEDVIEDVDAPTRTSSGTKLPAPRTPTSSSRSSPLKNIIPPRTSSLNRTPSPTRSRPRRLSKGKRAMTTLKEERPRTKSRRKSKADAIKDMFEGLDEENQTVKRIKELRRQKEDRLRKESEALQKPANNQRDVHDPPTLDASELDRRGLSANRVAARAPDLRKAHRMLGLDHPVSKSSTVHHDKPVTVSPLSRSVYNIPSAASGSPLKQNAAVFAPDYSNSSSALPPDSPILGHAFSTPSVSQHYSRANVAHTLGDPAHDSPTIPRRAVARKSTNSHLLNGLDIEGLDLSPPSTSHSNSTFKSHTRSASIRRPSYDARTRRKSMSDARENRLLEDEILRDRNDSVSAAVNAYLNNPRLNQKVCHPQTGRIISFSEVGDPRGSAVIVCVGMGLTRFVSAFYDDLASSLGLRLITPERPGVGASEPHRERDHVGPLGWPDDVLTITQHLGISQFSLIAHSAGAIYALATALILPQCVRGKVQLLAPWIPPSQFENINQKDRSPDHIPVAALTRGQRFLRVLPVPFLKAANGGLFSPASLKPANGRNQGSPGTESPRGPRRRNSTRKRPDFTRRESLILMDQVIPDKPRDTMFPLPELCEEERTGIETVRKPSFELSATASPMDPAFTLAAEALNAAEHSARAHQAAYSTFLTERTWTLATRDSNPVVDLIVCLERHRDIGFRYVDVQRKVVITHGTEDKRVPVENIRWIGDQMNRYSALHWDTKEKDLTSGGGCEIRILPGEGHGLMANPGVMADVLAEISGEWISPKW